MTVDIPPCCQ